MEQLRQHLHVQHVIAMGWDIVNAVVVTPARVFIFDTSVSPQAMQPVRLLVARLAGTRRVSVVISHHHWDHVYDSGPSWYCRRELGDRLTYRDPGGTVHLIHAPGHSEDSIVLYSDEERILLAGDTLEWPLPTLAQRDCRDVYIHTLRQLKQLSLSVIVPGHGKAMGKPLIDANERYISGLYEAVAEAVQHGVPRHELDLPAERLLPADTVVSDVYRRVHDENIAWAYADVRP
jgi:glyoxylase-like metal-dependent hydrolase (beta-lactamase superfamily II)